jgi:hypothetical protein
MIETVTAYAPAALGAASSIANFFSGGAQAKTQRAWEQYNANRAYSTAVQNAASYRAISSINAKLATMRGQMQAEAAWTTTLFDVELIKATSEYNSGLLDRQLEELWDAEELDQEILANTRAVERGQIVAKQASSGFAIGEGSHKEVVIDQRTQEALESFAIAHNADIQARSILNAQSQGQWQAHMAIQKTLFKGMTASISALASSSLEGAAMQTQGILQSQAQITSAASAREAGIQLSNANYSTNKARNWNNFASGMFNAASSAAGAYFKLSDPGVTEDVTDLGIANAGPPRPGDWGA